MSEVLEMCPFNRTPSMGVAVEMFEIMVRVAVQ